VANTLYDIPLKQIDGTGTTLSRYKGQVLLIVNVASKCGLTPQYTGLEKLYQGKRANGLEVLGFPANNFMGQEPGTEAEIKNFCSTTYDVHFPLFSKIWCSAAISIRSTRSWLPRSLQRPAKDRCARDSRATASTRKTNPMSYGTSRISRDRAGKVVGRFAPDGTG
jgi:glutathione peroxidase